MECARVALANGADQPRRDDMKATMAEKNRIIVLAERAREKADRAAVAICEAALNNCHVAAAECRVMLAANIAASASTDHNEAHYEDDYFDQSGDLRFNG